MSGDDILFWEYDWHAATQNQLRQLQKTAGSYRLIPSSKNPWTLWRQSWLLGFR